MKHLPLFDEALPNVSGPPQPSRTVHWTFPRNSSTKDLTHWPGFQTSPITIQSSICRIYWNKHNLRKAPSGKPRDPKDLVPTSRCQIVNAPMGQCCFSGTWGTYSALVFLPIGVEHSKGTKSKKGSCQTPQNVKSVAAWFLMAEFLASCG